MVHALLVLAAEEAEPSKTALLRVSAARSPPGPWCWASSGCAARSSPAASAARAASWPSAPCWWWPRWPPPCSPRSSRAPSAPFAVAGRPPGRTAVPRRRRPRGGDGCHGEVRTRGTTAPAAGIRPCSPCNLAIEIDGLRKAYGDVEAVRDISFSVAAGRGLLPPRPQRRGQDHHDRDPRGLPRPQRRRGARARPRPRGRRAGAARARRHRAAGGRRPGRADRGRGPDHVRALLPAPAPGRRARRARRPERQGAPSA